MWRCWFWCSVLHCIVEYIGDNILPGLVNPILFCKELVMPLCAANSYFACFLKTEQRKCHSFDACLNSSVSWGSSEGLPENHWKKNLCGGEKNPKMEHWNSAPEERERGDGALNQLPVSLFLCFCVRRWVRVPCSSYILPLPGVWANPLHRLEKSWVCGLWKGKEKKKTCFWTFSTATYTTDIPQQGVHGNKNIKSNNLGVWHTAKEDSCVFLHIIWNLQLGLFSSLSQFQLLSQLTQLCFCLPLGLHHTPLTTWRSFWIEDWGTNLLIIITIYA